MTGPRLLTYALAFGVALVAAAVALAFGAYEGTSVSYGDRVLLLIRSTWETLTGE